MMLSERLATSDGGSRPRRFLRATYLCVPQRSKGGELRYSLAARGGAELGLAVMHFWRAQIDKCKSSQGARQRARSCACQHRIDR